MNKNLSSNILLAVFAAAIMTQSPMIFAGSKAEDVQIQDMKMTEKELAFQHKLTDHAVESFIQMNHAQRAKAMEIGAEGSLTPDAAVMMVKKDQKIPNS
ncbi:MAG: hypothetical protein LLF94_05570 [Chlamydiales bacterium]|nr:hypothetical protein [Chlamydiales bacterium]